MMELYLYGKKVPTVFHLLGKRENALTYSLGWALSQSPIFLSNLIYATTQIRPSLGKVTLHLQEREDRNGITDVEIESPGEFFVVVEAKRGWNLPSIKQLETYSTRDGFKKNRKCPRKLLVVSECSEDYARSRQLPEKIKDVGIDIVSWKKLTEIAVEAERSAGNVEKQILTQLLTYFGSLMTMQNVDSNWVFVVSLGSGKPSKWKLSWIDIVNKKQQYFHPIGDGWPKEPPNYIAFRYGGELQTIHHVESYTVFDNPHKVFQEAPSEKWEHHFLYKLSKPIRVNQQVKTGKLYRNARVWCMLDTLFLAKTIADARDISTSRSKNVQLAAF